MMKQILLTIAMLMTSTFAVAEKSSGDMPKSWYSDAEEAQFLDDDNAETLELLKAKLGRILNVQANSLDNYNNPMEENFITAPKNKPKDWVPWRFAVMIGGMGITSTGSLGLVGLGGEHYANIFWFKKDYPAKMVIEEQEQEQGQNLTAIVTNQMSSNQVHSTFDALFKAAISTGRIENETAFRENFYREAKRFQEATYWIGQSENTNDDFYPYRFRADIAVSGQGQVHWGNVGGLLKLRMEWFRVLAPKKQGQPRTWPNSPMAKNLLDYLKVLTKDFRVLATDPKLAMSGFQLNRFKSALTVTLKGDVGMAKGQLDLSGQVYFKRNTTGQSRFMPASVDLADDKPLWVAGVDKIMKKIDREKFRKGLLKASKISNFLVSVAAEHQGKNWGVKKVEIGYGIIPSGGIHLVTLQGEALIEMSYDNLKF